VMCQQHGLLVTGGSDFHGSRDYDETNFGTFGLTAAGFEEFAVTIAARSNGLRKHD